MPVHSGLPHDPERPSPTWWHGGEGFDRRRPVSRELPALLQDTALSPWAQYTVAPGIDDASLLFEPYRLDEPAVRATATMHLGRAAHWRSDADRSRQAIESDMADVLAPGWLIVASREEAPAQHAGSTPVADTAPTTLPGAIAVDLTTDTTDVASSTGAVAIWEHSGTAHTERVGKGNVTGEPLGYLIREALRNRHIEVARGHLERYLTWIADVYPEGPAPERRPFVLPCNVAIDGEKHIPDNRLGRSDGPEIPVHVLAEAALLDIAETVAGHPGAHPFCAALDATGVAEELARLVGVDNPTFSEARTLLGDRHAAGGPAADPDPDDSTRIFTQDERLRLSELERLSRKHLARIKELESKLAASQRTARELSHALAVAQGPMPRRALYLLTTPGRRLVEDARSKLPRRER